MLFLQMNGFTHNLCHFIYYNIHFVLFQLIIINLRILALTLQISNFYSHTILSEALIRFQIELFKSIFERKTILRKQHENYQTFQ